MSFRDDKIKILQELCMRVIPYEISDDKSPIDITLTGDDFKKIGFSFNDACFILRKMFTLSFMHGYREETSQDGKNEVTVKISPEVEIYTTNYKYPETNYIDDEEYPLEENVILKQRIIFDKKIGIFKSSDINNYYPLKMRSKRYLILMTLQQKDIVFISDLQKQTSQNSPLLIKEIRSINLIFRKKLLLVDNLIISIPTGGYSLNKDKFDIVFS